MKDIVNKAKKFALAVHKGQKHGCLDMSDHLEAVTGKLTEYWNTNFSGPRELYNSQLAAAWLHDTVEDTDTTVKELADIFGFEIAYMVEALTDSPGKNRLTRHLETYHRIRSNKKAILIKLCDRWHNHKRSLENKEYRYCKDYVDEYFYFKFALYDGLNFLPFWKELDIQFEKLSKLVKENQNEKASI